MPSNLKRRVERLEGSHLDNEEVFDVAGIKMTGREIRQMFEEVDGMTRGLPSEKEGFKCRKT